jgi:hypothetical protein
MPEMNNIQAQDIIDRHTRLIGQRSNFESFWQTLHDYFYIESPDINAAYAPGSELTTSYLWDSTTLETGDVLASGFMNYLTPPTSKWFRLRAKNANLSENKDVSDYLEDVAAEVNYTLNRSNFYDQIFPSYKSSGIYGTSVLLEEEDIHDVARFLSIPLKQCVLVEDGRGRVVEYYIEFEYTAFQAASRWGKEKISKALQEELVERNDNKKHKFILFIAKRDARDVTKTDKKNMPVQAVWIDKEERTVIEEGGYNEFPAMTHRFDKRPNIVWGFSPAMKSLPFARILNAAAKTNLRAMMKRTDPPVALPENAFLMPFNANPRAINYYKKSAMDSSKDIFSFGDFGDPQFGMQAIEYYSQKVKSLMYNDVFLAFEGLAKQMNNPEIMERINEKMTLLGPAVGRWTAEVLNPIIVRTVGILFRSGKLPAPPDALINDPNYEIEFVGQLAQAQRRSELNTLVTAITMVGQMAQFAPDVLDKVDTDRTADEVWAITGAPVQVLRDDAEIAELREERANQAAINRQLQVVGAGAGVAEVASQVDVNVAQAKEKVKSV